LLSRILDKENFSETLPIYEKITASLLILLFLFAIAINVYLDEGKLSEVSDDLEKHYLVAPYVAITIRGAVAKPGVYQALKGSRLIDVINMAEPFDDANLNTFKSDSKVIRQRTVLIKEKKLTGKVIKAKKGSI